jgi:multiple sugar transport system permease protein
LVTQLPPTLSEPTDKLAGPSGPSRRRDGRAALAMLGPNVVLFTIFVGVPIVGGFLLSFFRWDLNGSPTWVGISNYSQLFHDPLVGTTVKNTVIFLALGVVPSVFISLGLALLINFRFPGMTIVRSLYLVPAAVSLAASAVIWQYIYEAKFGLLAYILSHIGITPPANGFLFDNTWALPSLDVIGIWTTLPIGTLLYLAALQRIPESVLEAASLDGAGWFRRVRYVIWPGVSNITLLVAIVALIAFTSSGFDLVNILTQGQPVYHTETLIYYIYYTAFDGSQWGYAAALSVLQFAIIGALLGFLVGVRRILVSRP